MPDKDLEGYQKSPQEFRKSLWRWLSDPHSGGEVGKYISKLWMRLKPLKALKKSGSSRLLKSLVIVAVLSLFAYFICRDQSSANSESHNSFTAILLDNAEVIAITSVGIIFLLEGGERQKRDHYESWRIINSAQGQTDCNGRIQTLEDLNKDDVNLEGTSAQGAALSGANLKGARLSRADLREAHFDKANLERTILFEANLQEANLQEANLQRAELWDANLQGANLQDANLQGAYLIRANLEGANLIRANLEGANLIKANLEGAILYKANLEGAILYKSNLQGAKYITHDQLAQVKLCRTALPESITLKPNRDCEDLDFDPETGISF